MSKLALLLSLRKQTETTDATINYVNEPPTVYEMQVSELAEYKKQAEQEHYIQQNIFELKPDNIPPANEPPPARVNVLAEYIIEGDQPGERYFLYDSTMPLKRHTDGTIELGLMIDDDLNRANKERFEKDRRKWSGYTFSAFHTRAGAMDNR